MLLEFDVEERKKLAQCKPKSYIKQSAKSEVMLKDVILVYKVAYCI